MSVRCGESPWPKSVVNGLPGVEVPVAGKVREMEARVLFNPATLLIPDGLEPTPGMPGDAPDGLVKFNGAYENLWDGAPGLGFSPSIWSP